MNIEQMNDFAEIENARDVLRDAIESLSEGFALYDDDRRLVMFNQRYAEMNKGVADLLKPGLDWEILMRESARRGIYKEAIGNEEAWVSSRLINGVEFIQDYELTETDGCTYLVSVHPTKLGGFVVTREDITVRKKAEETDREGDLLVRTVLDASSAAVVMARIGDGQILYKSPAAFQLYGNTKSSREHYANPEDRADLVTTLLIEGEANDYRIRSVNAKGEEFEASTSSRIAEYKGEEVVVTSIIDMTEQLEAEALIRQVLEACPVPIQMTKVEDGELLFRSPGTIELFGEAKVAHDYYVNPQDRKDYIAHLRKHGFAKDFKAPLVKSDGEEFLGAMNARLIDFKGDEVIVSNTRDLSPELAIQEELASQREMLFQNEKMSALGELLAGVAHELNNPLSVVVGHSLMMRDEITDPELATRVEKISNAAERCAKIVKTFLAMARQQPTRIEQVDLNGIVEAAVDVAGYGGKSTGISIDRDLASELPAISADGDQITQVLINLVINAEQAISGSGIGDRICVSTKQKDGGKNVEIIVADNGPGIPENIRARIFEPFFTTKDVGDGTGIGLAFCHRIILSHGGQIRLDADGKNGSRFRITLPVGSAPEQQQEEAPARSEQGTKCKVLVVDDEIDVGELHAEIIRREGYDVDVVTDGNEALRLLREKSYDVFLSDLNMPETDGRVIYETLRDESPELLEKTAFVTGDTMGASSKGLLEESGLPHVEKPVSPSEFRKLLDTLLNDKESKNPNG